MCAEVEAIREEYGKNSWGDSCLLARRLVERGVRYIHLYPLGAPDTNRAPRLGGSQGHLHFATNTLPNMDQAAGTLISDLKTPSGLYDETLVVWGGEFGRTPVSEAGDGRDHRSLRLHDVPGGRRRKGRHRLWRH